jgi:hypothetical protein
MTSFRSKPIGWRNESYRHYLAAKYGAAGVSLAPEAEERLFKRVEKSREIGAALDRKIESEEEKIDALLARDMLVREDPEVTGEGWQVHKDAFARQMSNLEERKHLLMNVRKRYLSKMWCDEIGRRVYIGDEGSETVKRADVIRFLEKNPEFVNRLDAVSIQLGALPRVSETGRNADFSHNDSAIRLAKDIPREELARVLKHEVVHVDEFKDDPREYLISLAKVHMARAGLENMQQEAFHRARELYLLGQEDEAKKVMNEWNEYVQEHREDIRALNANDVLERNARAAEKYPTVRELVKGEKKFFALKHVLKKGKVHVTRSGEEVRQLAREVVRSIRPHAERVEVAGSLRRGVKDATDADVVVIPKRGHEQDIRDLMRRKASRVDAEGSHKIETHIKGVDVDVMFANRGDWGAQMLRWTGPWQANVHKSAVAKSKGMVLNQYGLWKGEKRVASSERDIYKELGLSYLPPEKRGLPR